MKRGGPEKKRGTPAIRKGWNEAFAQIQRGPFYYRLPVMVVIATTIFLGGPHIRQAYAQAPPVIGESIAVLSSQSQDLDKNCEELRQAIDQGLKALSSDLSMLFFGLALNACKITPPDTGILSLRATNMRYPSYIVANRAGTRLYTTNFDSTVSTVDAASNSPIGTIQFPSRLDGGDTDYQLGDIDVNPMGTTLYVLNTIYRTTLPAYTLLGNTVEVIDTERNALITSVPLGLESQPSDVVVDATGSRIYVTTTDLNVHGPGQVEYLNSGKVNVIDAASNIIMKTIPIPGQAPGPMVANPDGLRVYVAVPRYFFYSEALKDYVNVPAQVAVIDTAENRVDQTIDLVGTSPRRLAINPTGTRLYVAHSRDDPFLEVIDTASNQVMTKIDIPVDSPVIGDIQVTADGAYLFMTVDVSTGDPDLLYIFDTSVNTIAVAVELPPDTQPNRMASFVTANDGEVPLSSFSSASLILQAPVIQVPGFGSYNASLLLTDPANLELMLTDVSGTGFQTSEPAVFSLDTGVLTLPVLGIDGKAFFEVDLALVPDPDGLRFRVTRVASLP